jgi:hypothetical protein
MNITITNDINLAAIYKDIDGLVQRAEDDLVEALKKAGISFVDKARRKTKSEGGFGNITWNLRASIACVIVQNHEIIYRYSPTVSNATEGNSTGLAYAEELALLTDDGDIMLIAVAGMDYAMAVQALGKDVIGGSSIAFEKEFLALINN